LKLIFTDFINDFNLSFQDPQLARASRSCLWWFKKSN